MNARAFVVKYMNVTGEIIRILKKNSAHLQKRDLGALLAKQPGPCWCLRLFEDAKEAVRRRGGKGRKTNS